MKKTIKFVAFAMVALMLMLTLVSCGSKPNATPADAKKALEKAGYEVLLVDSEITLKLTGIDGLVATIAATTKDLKNAVTIYYFKDSDSATKAYDKINGLAEEAKKQTESISVGKSDKMIWFGTKDAVKAAA